MKHRKLFWGVVLLLPSSAAHAELRFCNKTDHVQGVAVGYQMPNGGALASEGWWNIKPGECETPITGDLSGRYFYYRAEINGGNFDGGGFLFCTDPKEFTIIGDGECQSRGYDSEDFRQIDVGASTSSYTFELTTELLTGIQSKPDVGLKICNETSHTQSISVGYEAATERISEGWWNIEPDNCANIISSELTNFHYYYRAEVDGGDFDGQGFHFCTSPEVYTIHGDFDCKSRGYHRETFRKIEIGEGARSYTLTLVP